MTLPCSTCSPRRSARSSARWTPARSCAPSARWRSTSWTSSTRPPTSARPAACCAGSTASSSPSPTWSCRRPTSWSPSSIEGSPPTSPDVARTLVAAHLAAARGGLVLTDPRPSHVLTRADGTVVLLGTGAARPFPRERLNAYLGALTALRSEDQDAFATTVSNDLNLLPPDDALKAYALVALLADGALTQPTRLDSTLLLDGERRALEHVGAGLALAATVTPDPADLALARSLGQLTATLAHLGATEDWGALALAQP